MPVWNTMCGTCVFLKLMQDVIINTALIEACRGGRAETARVLLGHGANVDQVIYDMS